jgi:hypothetical protein
MFGYLSNVFKSETPDKRSRKNLKVLTKELNKLTAKEEAERRKNSHASRKRRKLRGQVKYLKSELQSFKQQLALVRDVAVKASETISTLPRNSALKNELLGIVDDKIKRTDETRQQLIETLKSSRPTAFVDKALQELAVANPQVAKSEKELCDAKLDHMRITNDAELKKYSPKIEELTTKLAQKEAEWAAAKSAADPACEANVAKIDELATKLAQKEAELAAAKSAADPACEARVAKLTREHEQALQNLPNTKAELAAAKLESDRQCAEEKAVLNQSLIAKTAEMEELRAASAAQVSAQETQTAQFQEEKTRIEAAAAEAVAAANEAQLRAEAVATAQTQDKFDLQKMKELEYEAVSGELAAANEALAQQTLRADAATASLNKALAERTIPEAAIVPAAVVSTEDPLSGIDAQEYELAKFEQQQARAAAARAATAKANAARAAAATKAADAARAAAATKAADAARAAAATKAADAARAAAATKAADAARAAAAKAAKARDAKLKTEKAAELKRKALIDAQLEKLKQINIATIPPLTKVQMQPVVTHPYATRSRGRVSAAKTVKNPLVAPKPAPKPKAVSKKVEVAQPDVGRMITRSRAAQLKK